MKTIRKKSETAPKNGSTQKINKTTSAKARKSEPRSAQTSIPPFFHPLSLEELIEQSGVKPIEDFDELAALWPGKNDAEAFLEFILSERQADRNTAK